MRRIIRILIPSLLLAALSAVGGVATAASETPAQPAAACTGVGTVAITQSGFVQSQWQGGFTAAISIGNSGQVNVDGWTLTFTFGGDQKPDTVWGAGGSQNGGIVTLKNLPYDAAIAPGQTISGVGFTGTWTNSDAAPTGFNLNGTLCS